MSRTDSRGQLAIWLRRMPLAVLLLGRFVRELLLANVQQARLVLSPRMRVEPRWIRFETELRSRGARTLLGVLISLTPGTLTCDLQGGTLLLHALNAPSEDEVVERIRQRFESLLVRMESA